MLKPEHYLKIHQLRAGKLQCITTGQKLIKAGWRCVKTPCLEKSMEKGRCKMGSENRARQGTRMMLKIEKMTKKWRLFKKEERITPFKAYVYVLRTIKA